MRVQVKNARRGVSIGLMALAIAFWGCGPGLDQAAGGDGPGGAEKSLKPSGAERAAPRPKPAGADPFGPAPRAPQSPEASVHGARSFAAGLESSKLDEARLEGALSLLHLATQAPKYRGAAGDPVTSLRVLLSHSWRRQPGESWRAMLERLSGQFAVKCPDDARRWNDYAERFRRLSTDPWPLDWRSQREAWLDLVDLMLRTHAGEDLDEQWRAAIAADPARAEISRRAYLLSLRGGTGAALNFGLVEPLLSVDRDGLRQIQARAEILATLVATRTPPGDPVRVRVRTELFDRLRARPDDISVFASKGLLLALASAYASGDPQAEQQPLLEILVTRYSPAEFVRFAREIQLPKPRQTELFLAKPVSVAEQNASLSEVLARLVREVHLAVWIDDAVRQAKVRVAAATLKGPWLEVVESALHGTPYQLRYLGFDVFWIGPPERFDAAKVQKIQQVEFDRFRRAARLGLIAAPAANALQDMTNLEFIRTPWQMIAAFLSDMHDVTFVVSPARAEHVLTCSLKGVSLENALDALSVMADIAWDTDGELVFVGDAREVAAFRQAAGQRASRRAAYAPGVADRLQTRFDLRASDTPLDQVLKSIGAAGKIEVTLNAEATKVGAKRISADFQKVPVDAALDVLAVQHGIVWEAKEDRVVIAGR